MMRVVTDASDPLPADELRDVGNKLLTDARNAAIEALHKSAQATLLRPSYTTHQIRRFRDAARDAAQEWQRVDGLLSEILREVDKTKGTQR